MKKKETCFKLLISLSGLVCILLLLLVVRITSLRISDAEEALAAKEGEITRLQQEFKAAHETLDKVYESSGLDSTAAAEPSGQAQLEKPSSVPNGKTSVFSQNSSSEAASPEGNGHIIGIDPGHQGPNVDMSALEPNGPGSSEMKVKATSGTQGIATGLPEYQLNLDVALKLKEILEERGYKTVLTRTDNDTAISNMERAQYAAEEGAEIYVRIHANGEDSHTASGALTMSPSASNPYIAELYEESNRLSQCMIDAYCETTGLKNLGVQYYDNMTGINWSTVPVTIIEMGFMSNENDDRQMSDPAFQETMALGIADGIDAYFN